MNEWLIIVLPALPSVVVGVAAIVFATLYVREKRDFRATNQRLNVALAELHSFDGDNESLVENNAGLAKENHRLEDENAKLHVQVKALVAELSARSNEIKELKAHPFVVEKGYVDGDTLATNTQTSPKTRSTRKRQATTPSSD